MKTISFINAKGGVSKSVSAAAIASLLAKSGKKVLIVDLDPQANASSLLKKSSQNPIGNLLQSESVTRDELDEFILPTYDPNIYIIPGDESLTDVIYLLYDQTKPQDDDPQSQLRQLNVYNRLNNILKLVKGDYDYVIVDNSPFTSYLTYLSLYASDVVLAPIDLDNFSYEGLLLLFKRIMDVNRHSDEAINFKVFFTRVNYRTNLFKSLQQQYEEVLGDIFCKTYIRQDNCVREAATMYMPLPDYAPKANATMDYLDLLKEVLDFNNGTIRQIKKILYSRNRNK